VKTFERPRLKINELQNQLSPNCESWAKNILINFEGLVFEGTPPE
jgi:hypothetical protein